MSGSETLRVANAGGYWGDDPTALRRQLLGPSTPHFIAMDFLAEISMSILQKQRGRDPSVGYARDFVQQMAPLLCEARARSVRVITNAGGVNPAGCAGELLKAAAGAGVPLRVAVVSGDDILDRLPAVLSAGAALKNMETGEDFSGVVSRCAAANAYFGAWPVARALDWNPDIVVSGRVTDTGLTLGPMIHAFGWAPDDYDRLAHGIVAGHIAECGSQSTGGNFTDWHKVRSFNDIGYPIIECSGDGPFVVTKHPGSGGLVTCQTVREQLLYEMGDPSAYLTPDVSADFLSVRLEQEGPDRVRVSGIRGNPPTDLLKVSAAYVDGWKISGTLIVSGPRAKEKADALARIFRGRFRGELSLAGLSPCEAEWAERVGYDSCHRGLTPPGEPAEILLRVSARDGDRRKLDVFRKTLPGLILGGPPGVAVTGGAPAHSEVMSYWPALMPRHLAVPRLSVISIDGRGDIMHEVKDLEIPWPEIRAMKAVPCREPAIEIFETRDPDSCGPTVNVPIMRIAHARSGDKGDTVNIGLIGRSEGCFTWMRRHVTGERVAGWFADFVRGEVVRYEVPNLWALNFLLEGALGGGGTKSLFLDAQGKTLGQAILACRVDVPESLLEGVAPGDRPDGGWL